MDLKRKLYSLQQISKAHLSKILNTSTQPKCLVLEPLIIRPLEKVCGVKWLRDMGVEKIYKFDGTHPEYATNSVYYMIFNSNQTFKRVVEQIRSLKTQKEVHLIVVPKYLVNFEVDLEGYGLLDTPVLLHSFTWLPICLDEGILSLELPQCYSTLFLQQNLSFLPSLARSLWELCLVVGKPRNVLALGRFATKLIEQVDFLETEIDQSDRIDSDFGSLIVIDRSVDYASAFLTPGVYSALLHEVYSTRAGVCEYSGVNEAQKKEGSANQRGAISLVMDSSQDPIYAELKNRYFTEVTSVLSNLTKQLKSEKHNSREMNLDEMKNYIQNQLQATKQRKQFISSHLMAAEAIIKKIGVRFEQQRTVEMNILYNTQKSGNYAFLEELLLTSDDAILTLRLFCLLSVAQNMSQSEIRTFWRKFIHRFGYKYSGAFRNLISAGFVENIQQQTPQTSTRLNKFLPKFGTEFTAIAARLKQIPDNPEKVNLKCPSCSSYVFGGVYVPVIVKIAGLVLNSTTPDEIRAKLAGLGPLVMRQDRNSSAPQRSVLVYFVGGVTYAETAACNLLETLTGSKIVVMADRVIGGDDLVRDILET